jgi:hypothetical protein
VQDVNGSWAALRKDIRYYAGFQGPRNSRPWKLRHTRRNSATVHASCGKSLWTLRVGPDSIFTTDQVIEASGVRGSLGGARKERV